MMDFIIKYWVEALCGLGIAVLTWGYNQLKKRIKEHEELREGLIAILHDRLYQSGMYFLEKGEIPLSAMQNIEEMYTAYHNLGGNGTGTEIYERVQELEIKK